MIKIDTSKYKIDIEIDGVITPIRVYPLSTETSIVLSELWDTRDRVSKRLDSINTKQEKLKKENPDSNEIDKLATESFKLQRELMEILNKFFESTIVEYNNFKAILKMIPVDQASSFLEEIFLAMQGNKKKVEADSDTKLIESETRLDL